ncbi:hypothetical protein K435DRAFT_715677 [Dendrothele bispora CBS 962.96]|uniref:Uncharacterized protein n=1 Tax=Dendrothele bispora (strain CBS 962.96) TaxID=1314807 RepID=A0A4V4HHM9_DENBC|nr:hypothetical protein K435DRAFT_715677 [Dendrothele bispora CBS 962.96]
MATSPPIARNTFNSESAPSNSRTKDWARSGEPGSAFSGLTKSRRGTGRGGGRGTRGTRGGRGGGHAAGTSRIASNPPPVDKPIVDKSTEVPTTKSVDKPVEKTPSQPVEKPEIKRSEAPVTAPSSDKPSDSLSTPKPKSASRRSSTRSIPSIVLPPNNITSDTNDTIPTPKSARPANRRRRSQNGSSRAQASKKDIPPPLDQNLLRSTSQRGRNRLPQPPHSAPPMKDAPPHLSASGVLDVRNDIDALVERVRAVAMDRPSTPGSHIDWAGDEDDSLPDLDDWGVHTSTTSKSEGGQPEGGNIETTKNVTISPIMVEGLKSLPEPCKPSTPEKDAQSLPSTVGPLPEHPPKEKADSAVKKAETSPGKSTKEPKAPSHSPTARIHLHPSLPPKPMFTDTSSPNAKRNQAPRHPQSNKSTFNKSNPVNPRLPEQAKPVQQAEKVEAPTKTEIPLSAPVNAQEGKVEQKKTEEKKEEKGLIDDEPSEGLSASIHAPKFHSDSLLTTQESGSNRPPRNFVHNRAHTVGRPPSFLQSAPAHGNSRFSRSGFSTPRGPDQGYHARTHSSPPAGATHHRSHSRPVITGDAISRLARTIGSSSLSPSPSRTAVSLTSKD